MKFNTQWSENSWWVELNDVVVRVCAGAGSCAGVIRNVVTLLQIRKSERQSVSVSFF